MTWYQILGKNYPYCTICLQALAGNRWGLFICEVTMDLDAIKNMMHALPFIGMVQRGDPRGRPLVTRLIETSLPGVITGAAVAAIIMYGDGRSQGADIVSMKKVQEDQAHTIVRIEERIEKNTMLILEAVRDHGNHRNP